MTPSDLKVAREIVAHGGPYMTPLSARALETAIAQALSKARQEERERCAEIASDIVLDHPGNAAKTSDQIATAIRQLGEGK